MWFILISNNTEIKVYFCPTGTGFPFKGFFTSFKTIKTCEAACRNSFVKRFVHAPTFPALCVDWIISLFNYSYWIFSKDIYIYGHWGRGVKAAAVNNYSNIAFSYPRWWCQVFPWVKQYKYQVFCLSNNFVCLYAIVHPGVGQIASLHLVLTNPWNVNMSNWCSDSFGHFQ